MIGLAMRLYLVSHWFYLKKIPIIPGFIMRMNRVICSCDIPFTAKIHPTVTFGHNGLGCVIHERAIIKENVTIMQNVTIGGRGKSGVPTIEKGVFIGAGACVLGGIVIGEYAKIGSNAVVLTDVPCNVTVVGIPARKVNNLSENQ